MANSFGISKKIVQGGIKKDDFIKKYQSEETLKGKLSSIFDNFDTNQAGANKGVWDVDEQKSFLAYFRRLDSSGDTNIQKNEINDKLFESYKNAEAAMEAYTELTSNETEDTDITIDNYTYADNGTVETIKTDKGTQTTKPGGVRAHLSNDWQNRRIGETIKNNTAEDDKLKQIPSSKTAKEVLEHILESSDYKDIDLNDTQKDELLTLMIKANPSIFNPNNGTVYLYADWGKFDFPDESYVGSKSFDTSSVTNTGASSIADLTSGEKIDSFAGTNITIEDDYTAPVLGGYSIGESGDSDIPEQDAPDNIPKPDTENKIRQKDLTLNIPQPHTVSRFSRYNNIDLELPSDIINNQYPVYKDQKDITLFTKGGLYKCDFDENGYVKKAVVSSVFDRNEITITRKSDGSISSYEDKTYDISGNVTREVYRNSDGTADHYIDYSYDENGKKTREVYRNSDGFVEYYIDYSYDENGKKTREVKRNFDGFVEYYIDYSYDENGNKIREVKRDQNGKLLK